MSSSQLLFSFGSVRNKTSIVPVFPVNGVHFLFFVSLLSLKKPFPLFFHTLSLPGFFFFPSLFYFLFIYFISLLCLTLLSSLYLALGSLRSSFGLVGGFVVVGRVVAEIKLLAVDVDGGCWDQWSMVVVVVDFGYGGGFC